jgi:aspartyl-tRNA(Asn)/glutamyl-tRNA(Gln) amidotransferase subunit B
MNSFRFLEKGIRAEIARQEALLRSGEEVVQETLHFDPRTETLTPLRSKEEAHDYRYFPEPDLLPLELTEAWVREVKSRLPELPEQRRARFVEQYGLSEYDAGVLTADMELATFYEKVSAKANPKQAANWVSGELRARLNEAGVGVAESKVEPGHLIELIDLLKSGAVSRSAAKDVLNTVFETGDSPAVIVEREGLASVGGDELSGLVDEVIAANPNEAGRVRAGDKKVIGFLVGQAMRASRGNADGGRVRQLLAEKLNG